MRSVECRRKFSRVFRALGRDPLSGEARDHDREFSASWNQILSRGFSSKAFPKSCPLSRSINENCAQSKEVRDLSSERRGLEIVGQLDRTLEPNVIRVQLDEIGRRNS